MGCVHRAAVLPRTGWRECRPSDGEPHPPSSGSTGEPSLLGVPAGGRCRYVGGQEGGRVMRAGWRPKLPAVKSTCNSLCGESTFPSGRCERARAARGWQRSVTPQWPRSHVAPRRGNDAGRRAYGGAPTDRSTDAPPPRHLGRVAPDGGGRCGRRLPGVVVAVFTAAVATKRGRSLRCRVVARPVSAPARCSPPLRPPGSPQRGRERPGAARAYTAASASWPCPLL